MMSSGSGSMGSVAAFAATASNCSESILTGVPSARKAGLQAIMAEGLAASGAPKSTTWAIRSLATALTSSNCKDWTASTCVERQRRETRRVDGVDATRHRVDAIAATASRSRDM